MGILDSIRGKKKIDPAQLTERIIALRQQGLSDQQIGEQLEKEKIDFLEGRRR